MEKNIVKTLWIVSTECTDPAREMEFNKWYSEVHVPDIKKAAGQDIKKVLRYKNNNPSSEAPQYMALYELNTDDPTGMLERLDKANEQWSRDGRIIDCIKLNWMGIYDFIAEI